MYQLIILIVLSSAISQMIIMDNAASRKSRKEVMDQRVQEYNVWLKSQLCVACKNNDERKFKRYLPKVKDVNFLNSNENIDPLHIVVKYHPKNVNMVRALIERGANVNSTSGLQQKTCLDIAATGQFDELVELLLKRGANLKSLDNYGNSALINAVQSRIYAKYRDREIDNNFCTRTIKLLLTHGKKSKDHILQKLYHLNEYIIKGNKEAAHKWIQEETVLDLRAQMKEPICLAYLSNQLELADALEKKGVVRPTSLLHDAIEFEDNNLVEKILSRNSSDINNVFLKYTALQHAVMVSKSHYLVEILLNFGAKADDEIKDEDFPDLEGKTALHIVMMRDDNELAEKIRKKHMAKVVQVLLSYNANPNIQDRNGKTVMHIACKYGNIECVVLLMKAKADWGITDSKGRNALHHAAANKENPEIIQYLLTLKDIFHSRDLRGKLPLHYAASEVISQELKNNMRKYQLLRKRGF